MVVYLFVYGWAVSFFIVTVYLKSAVKFS